MAHFGPWVETSRSPVRTPILPRGGSACGHVRARRDPREDSFGLVRSRFDLAPAPARIARARKIHERSQDQGNRNSQPGALSDPALAGMAGTVRRLNAK